MSKMQAELIDRMGDDLTVVNSARVSFQTVSTELKERDKKLIKYLASHDHWTPFAHVQLSFRVKAPIFIARQMVKHQVGLVWNEVSRRYVDSEPEFYSPTAWRGRPDGSIKQGSGGIVDLSSWHGTELGALLRQEDGDARDTWSLDGEVEEIGAYVLELYKKLLAAGVAPEQARIILPQSTMTEWVWSGSLVAFARIVKQRTHEGAQEEAKELALLIKDEIESVSELETSWLALLK
jgi:thymidylate synthase (FAD)